MVRIIRDRRRIGIAEAIQTLCAGPAIEAEYRRVVKEMHDELHGPATSAAKRGAP